MLFNFGSEGYPYATWKFSGNTGSIIWTADNPTPNAGGLANGFAPDNLGNVWVTGSVEYSFPNTEYGTYKINSNGAYTVTNLYPEVSGLSSVATSIVVDQVNSAYVTGYSPGTNGADDIVTIKYSANGNTMWVQQYNGQGNGNAEGNAIAVDAIGNVYVTGYETTAAGGTGMVTIKYAPVASIQKQGNGSFLLQEQVEPGEALDFQASTDLQAWLDLGTVNADTNGNVQFLDTNASNFNQRFYLTVPQ